VKNYCTYISANTKEEKRKNPLLGAKLCTDQTLPEVSTSIYFTGTNNKFMKPKKFLR
jgi:hypothetical protein